MILAQSTNLGKICRYTVKKGSPAANKAIIQKGHTLMKALVLKTCCSFFSLWPLLMLLTAVFVLQSEQDWRQ